MKKTVLKEIRMKTYEITWRVPPISFTSDRVSRVEANTESDARKLLHDAIRGSGIGSYSISYIYEYKPSKVEGRVLSL